MARRSAKEYTNLAKRAILALLEEELAAPWIEVEARVADASHPSIGIHIEPHHLSEARRSLLGDGSVSITNSATRGGRSIPMLHLTGASGRRFNDASARKRLLAARYYGWATGTPSRPGRIGPAGEAAAHAALKEASTAAYSVVNPGQPVPRLLGVELSGSLDAAAHHLPVDANGTPGDVTTVPIEVKNIRDWIYPNSPELYQVLSKAALVQAANPERRVAPVLICRKAHITTMRMARDVGFFIIPAERQYIASVDERALVEIRTELGLVDLVQQVGADERLVRFLQVHLPKVIDRTAGTWASFGPDLMTEWDALRRAPDRSERDQLLQAVRAKFRELTEEFPSGW